jgi:hypothetical protein
VLLKDSDEMRFFEILLEYRRDVTQRQYGNKLIDRVRQSDKELFDSWYTHMSNKNYSIEKINNTIQKSLLASFENSDPTPNNQYTPWIVREYVKGNIRRLEDLTRINQALQMFHQYKNTRQFKELFLYNPDFKDVMKLDASQIEGIAEKLDAFIAKGNKKEIDKGKAEEVYQDSDIRVISPLDEKAACYYGQGTRWCTASTKGTNYFDQYNREGPLYIILPKKPSYEGEKYQLHIESKQFMDEKDVPIPLTKLLNYPNFVYYLKANSDIDNLIVFMDDSVLKKMNKLLITEIIDYVLNEIHDLELEDEGFIDHMAELAREKGYVTDDGAIDWDKTYDDSQINDYRNYNPDSFDQYSKFKDALSWDKKEMINIIDSNSDQYDDYSWIEIYNFPKLYEVDGIMSRNSELARRISRKIDIVDNDPQHYANTLKHVYKAGTAGDYAVYVNTLR